MGEYVTVKELPEPVRAALEAVGYRRSDVEVLVAPSVVLSNAGSGSGRQAFTALVNLSDGRHHLTWGSWGGANMFNTSNPVDLDDRPYTLPVDGVAITGSRGGGHPVWATVYVPASAAERMLPGPREALPTAERDALYCHKAITGGAYRRDELRRRNVGPDTIDALVLRGLLKRNKAGSVQITTAGKNALGDYRGH